MTVRWAPKAAADLERISVYLRDHAPYAEERIILEIYGGIRSLRDLPYKGRSAGQPRTRQLVLSDIQYIVTYRVTDTLLEIIRIRHASRRPLRN